MKFLIFLLIFLNLILFEGLYRLNQNNNFIATDSVKQNIYIFDNQVVGGIGVNYVLDAKVQISFKNSQFSISNNKFLNYTNLNSPTFCNKIKLVFELENLERVECYE